MLYITGHQGNSNQNKTPFHKHPTAQNVKQQQYQMLTRMRNKNSPSSPEGMQNGMVTVENSGQFLTELNILLLQDPAIMLLGIYPKELRSLLTQKLAHGHGHQLCSQLPKCGSNQDALQQIGG